MSRIAAELSRRTSSQYVGGRAKEVATVKAKETGSNPKAMGLLGALAGGAAGALLGKQLKQRMSKRYYESERGFRAPGGSYVTREYVEEPSARYVPGEYAEEPSARFTPAGPDYSASPEVSGFAESYRTPTAESEWAEARGEQWREEQWRGQPPSESKGEMLKGKAQGFKEKISSRAHDLAEKTKEGGTSGREAFQERKDHFKERASHLRERMPSGGQLKERASHLRERMPSGGEMKERAGNWPLATIAGGIALGALFAALIPETNKERKAFSPAKQKATGFARDKFEHTREEMGGRIREAKDVLMKHEEEQEISSARSGSESPARSTSSSGSQWLPPEAPTSEDRAQQRELRTQAEEDKLH